MMRDKSETKFDSSFISALIAQKRYIILTLLVSLCSYFFFFSSIFLNESKAQNWWSLVCATFIRAGYDLIEPAPVG